MRRSAITLAILVVAGVAFGNPSISSAISKERANITLSFVADDGAIHSLGLAKGGVAIDTIQYCFDIGDPNTPAGALDYTCTHDSVWWQFTPIADGTLMAVQGCFHTSGMAKLYVCRYMKDECYYLMDDPTINPNLLPSQLFWNITNNDSIWQTKDLMAYSDDYHVPLLADTDYAIGYRTDNEGHPYINYDYPDERYTPPHWRFSYCHQTIDSNWLPCLAHFPPHVRTYWVYNPYGSWPPYVEIMLRVIVEYPSPPPIATDLSQLMDSFPGNLSKVVNVQVRELDGYLQRAELYWKVRNTGFLDSTRMQLESPQATYYTAWGNITGSYSSGDTIDYWCHFWDDDGQRERWVKGEEPVKTFIIRKLHSDADILLVNDQGGDREGFYRQILDNLGYQYNYWSVSDFHGLNQSVIGAGDWNTAIIFGDWAATLPGKDYLPDDLWVSFLEGGSDTLSRNVLYIDQDYFCAHREDYDCDFDGGLSPGEFLYDYFGVRKAQSDVPNRDTLFTFIDTLTANGLVGHTFQLSPDSVNGASWTDYTRAREGGADLFFADVGGDTCGVRYEGPGFKTAFLPFLLEAAIDPATKEPLAEADSLIHGILRWFGTKDSLSVVRGSRGTQLLPVRFGLSQNYPNPFNSTTLIRYTVPAISHQLPAVTLKIYNILGQGVRTLVDKEQGAGYHQVLWDGRDNKGHQVASGIYLFRLKVGDYAKARKAVLLR